MEEVEREIVEADIIEIDGSNLYILNQYRGLAICDISSPDDPSITGRCPMDGDPIEMYIRDDYAYVIIAVPQASLIRPMRVGIAADSNTSEARSRVEVIRIADPSNPQIVGTLDVLGRVTDSRIVGNILYVVSSEEPVYYYAASKADDSVMTSDGINVYAAAIDLSNPGNPVEAGRIDFGGSARYIHVTEQAIFIASDSPAFGYSGTHIAYVDISDPGGAIRKRGSFDIPGSVQDEFKMDYSEGYFRVCTHEWNEAGGLSRLFVIDVTDPDAPVRTGALELGKGEQLFATRFDGDRAYMVTFEVKDPLWVIDLTDPAAPEITGELVVPGWSTYIQPMGDHLVALGVDDTTPGQNLVAVSLFNVADPAKPTLTKRVSFGETSGWTWSSAGDDVKSLTILEEMGLILLPYTTSYSDDNGYVTENRLQLIDYSPTELVPRGWVAQKGTVLRGRSYMERLFSVSTEELQVIDASNRDKPRVTAQLPLAENVVDFVLLGNGFGARLTDSDGNYSLQAVSADNQENVIGEVPLTDSGYTCQFVNGNLLYIVTNHYGWGLYSEDIDGEAAYRQSTKVTVFDFSIPTAPRMRGTIELDGNHYTPVYMSDAGVRYPDYNNGEIVQVKSDLLAFVTINSFDATEVDAGFSIVDLSDPDSPDLVTRHAIEEQGATGFFAKSGVVYYSYAVDDESDEQGRPRVKYYLGRVDMADPADPADLPGINIPGICLGMDTTGAYAYTIDNLWATEGDSSVEYTFNALRIEDGTAYLMDEAKLSEYYGHFTIADGFAYMDGYSWFNGESSMIIIDLADPENLKKYENDLPLWGATVIGAKDRTVFLSLWSGIGCYDVQDPENPELTDFRYGYSWTGRIHFSDDSAFLPMGWNGIWVKQL